MKDEFTEKMHSEFTISDEDEIQLKAGCVWDKYRELQPSDDEIKKRCKSYGITFEQAMRWKTFWLNLQ